MKLYYENTMQATIKNLYDGRKTATKQHQFLYASFERAKEFAPYDKYIMRCQAAINKGMNPNLAMRLWERKFKHKKQYTEKAMAWDKLMKLCIFPNLKQCLPPKWHNLHCAKYA